MSQESHVFKLHTRWTGNSNGDGIASGEGWEATYGVPVALGGAPGRANPEELLIGAVASCFCITLALLAERKRLPLERIEMDAEGTVERQLGGTLKFTAIRLSPVLHSPGADETQVRSLTDAAHKAEQYCPISNAVRGNVTITVEPEVRVTGGS
jgi:peroxiredoxin-like protein